MGENLPLMSKQFDPESLLKEKFPEYTGKCKEYLTYYSCNCPFHPPDTHPSFMISKTTGFAVDFHDGKKYPIGDLLGVYPTVKPKQNKESKNDVYSVIADQLTYANHIYVISFSSRNATFLVYMPEDGYYEIAEGKVIKDIVTYFTLLTEAPPTTEDVKKVERLITASRSSYKGQEIRNFDVFEQYYRGDKLYIPFRNVDVEVTFRKNAGRITGIDGWKTVKKDPVERPFLYAIPVDFAEEKTDLSQLFDLVPPQFREDLIAEMAKPMLMTGERQIFLNYGPGSTGKSTFTDFLARAYGKGASIIEPETMTNRFENFQLVGKVVIILNELGKEISPFTERKLKDLAGNNLIRVEKKMGDVTSYRIKAHLIINSNYLPFRDVNLIDRLALIPFVKKRTGMFQFNVNLTGLFYELVNSLDKVIQYTPKYTVEHIREMTSKEKPDDGIDFFFIRSRTEGKYTRFNDIYTAYVSFCISRGYVPVTVNDFASIVEERLECKRRKGELLCKFNGTGLLSF